MLFDLTEMRPFRKTAKILALSSRSYPFPQLEDQNTSCLYLDTNTLRDITTSPLNVISDVVRREILSSAPSGAVIVPSRFDFVAFYMVRVFSVLYYSFFSCTRACGERQGGERGGYFFRRPSLMMCAAFGDPQTAACATARGRCSRAPFGEPTICRREHRNSLVCFLCLRLLLGLAR